MALKLYYLVHYRDATTFTARRAFKLAAAHFVQLAKVTVVHYLVYPYKPRQNTKGWANFQK